MDLDLEGGLLSPKSYVDVPTGPQKSASLYTNFCPISHPAVYHFWKKSIQLFWPNWVIFTRICPKYTQFMLFGLLCLALYQISRKCTLKDRPIYAYHVNVRAPPPTGLDLLAWFAISSLFRHCKGTWSRCLLAFYKARCYISSWKAFLAMLTLIGFIFGMSHDVIFEGIFPGKTFLAMLTLTWFRLGWILRFHQATCIYKTFARDCSHWYGFSLVWVLMTAFKIWLTFGGHGRVKII